MVPPTVRRFLSEKFYSRVSPHLLMRFFKRYDDVLPKVNLGEGSEAEKRRRLRPVMDALDDPRAAKVIEDLQRIAMFCRDDAFKALQERANYHQRNILWLHDEATIYERRATVLRLFIETPEIFDRAEEWLAIRLASPRHEYQGLYPREIDLSDEARHQFELGARALYGRLCGENYCRVAWHEDGNRIAVVLFHGDAPTSTVAIEGEAELPVCFRELKESVVIYDIDTGRLQVTGRTEAERELLVSLFARVVVGDETFFQHPDARNLYTLDRLAQEARGFRLADPDGSILSQHVVEVQGRLLEESGEVMVLRDKRDALGKFVQRAGDKGLQGWEIQHVVVRLEFLVEGRKLVRRVWVEPPEQAMFNRSGCEREMMGFLSRNGLCHVTEQITAALYV